MKKVIQILILTIFTVYGYCDDTVYSKDIQYYNDMFNAISKVRKGLSKEEISKVINPFYLQRNAVLNQTNDTNATNANDDATPSFTLYAIINRTAKINDNWYVVGNHIGLYKIKSISSNSVILHNSANNTNLNLQINDKGNNSVFISY